ncbi:MAG: putative transglycosylase [Micrococcaceae bacterium]|nr:putative transglycosylase [Micrococcaceae bacterium]
MSTNAKHGRRSAAPARRSAAHVLAAHLSAPFTIRRRIAVVGVAAAILAGGSLSASALPLEAAADVSAAGPVSVSPDAPLTFVRSAVSSTAGAPAAPTGANGGAVDDPAGAQAYAAGELASFGWGQDQMSCLVPLWNRESDWRTTAENPSSLAYGIVQSLPAEKMDSVGTDWKTNYQTQVKWGLKYIQDRYGSPCGAWQHELSVDWY